MKETVDTPATILMNVVLKDQPKVGFTCTTKSISTDLLPHEVLVKVISASFCGTDAHIYEYDNWAKNRLKLPLTVGHEFAGKVIKIGSSVSHVQVGDIISAETHIICGTCEFCLRGEGHICENTKIIGVDTNGCFANYIKMPEANCFVNDPSVDPTFLSVQEPLGNAVHTMAHFPIAGKTVAILGCGPIGLMAVDVAKALGAKMVIAIEVNSYRARLAKELGADYVINPKDQDTITEVFALTNGRGVDVIGEFSGNKRAIQDSFKYLKAGGGLSMLGIPHEPIEIDVANDIVFKGIQIYGVVGRRIYETWYQVKELIASGKLHLDKIVTHKLPMSKVNDAGALMVSKECGKIILVPEEDLWQN